MMACFSLFSTFYLFLDEEIAELEDLGDVIHDSTTGTYTLVIQIPPV